MSTYVLSGVASGMGRATASLLESQGHRVIGIDRADAEVVADLSTAAGREAALQQVQDLTDVVDGAAMFAGLVGATGRPAGLLLSVNYFGSVVLLEGLRPLLAAAGESSALVMSSNSVTIQPRWNPLLVEACLAGDERVACAIADEQDSLMAYPASKAALARWVRRNAPTWAADGIRLNAIAPGMVETAMVAETRADPVLGSLVDALPIPVGRGGQADELAALAAFVMGPSGRFFCGSVILCDGGTEALLRPDDWPARWEV